MSSPSALRHLRVLFCAILFSVSITLLTNSLVYASPESDVIDAVNKVRQSQGLGTLTSNNHLADAAKAHNIVMNACASEGRDGCTAHTVPGELGLMDRIKATGYAAYGVAENIAWGQATGDKVVSDWMNSPGHRANIENGRLKEVGCAYLDGNSGQKKRIFWTCNFGFTKDQDLGKTTATQKPSPIPQPKQTSKTIKKSLASPSPSASPSASPDSTLQATPSATPNVILTSVSSEGLTYEIPAYVRPAKIIQILYLLSRPACWVFPSLESCSARF
jgi:uncharacterized protein YkwD